MINAVPVDFSDASLAAEIADGLVGVEKVLGDAAQAEESLLTEASRHLIDAGGKRFRATLVLLAAHFGDSHDERIVPAAAAIELTHLATLFHDDVMDEASIRRGTAERELPLEQHDRDPHRGFPVRPCLQHPGRAGRRGDQDPGRDLHQAGERPGRGDPGAAPGPGPPGALPAGGGGQDGLAHRDRRKVRGDVRRRPGRRRGQDQPASHALGVAFQLSDDILDVASESAQSGKAPGTDLREGVRSLPVLHALRAGRPATSGCGNCCRGTA